jgi:1,4-dihydroxy-2-naphthoate octaprenyltransferase
MIGSAMAHAEGGFHIPAALAALFGAVMIQIGTNLANDYFDFTKGSDRSDRLGPMRVTQAGLVSPSEMKQAIVIVFALAFLAGIYLVYLGGWPIVFIGLLSILFGVLYTAGPFPIGYIGLGELFVVLFFGPVAVAGTYYVQTLQLNSTVILAGISPGLFSVAILAINNLRDIDSDRDSGKRTLAVRFGPTFARMEYAVSIVVACLIPVVIVVRDRETFWPLLPLLVLPLAKPHIKLAFTTTSGRALNELLATTGRLLLVFSLLFSLGWLL